MEILNTICYGSALLFTSAILVALVASFVSSIVLCFQKKVEGGLLSKIAVALALGSVCPWVLRLAIFFFDKMLGM